MSSGITHVGFADESYWNIGRYRSLGLVTASVGLVDRLQGDLKRLLDESGVAEFKWKNLDGAKERLAAIKMCEFAIENAIARKLRVDVLIWDIQDSRHNVPGRDDIANLQRMYYHLFRNVLRARWPNDAVWRLYPDEHTALDWETVRECLEKVSVTVQRERSLSTGGEFRIRLRREFGIEEIRPIRSDQHLLYATRYLPHSSEIRPIRSDQHPLLQLADLFAGLAAFSHEQFGDYQEWLRAISSQQSLFNQAGSINPSRSSRERYQVLNRFDTLCKQHKLGVSLRKRRGLLTPDPNKPINFWLYEPQRPEDKAPRREEIDISAFTESDVESAGLAWLSELGWQVKYGSEIAPDGLLAERQDYGQVVLEQRLRDALARLNPDLPPEALQDAFRKLTRPEGATLEQRNRTVYRMLVDGVMVEYRRAASMTSLTASPATCAMPLSRSGGARIWCRRGRSRRCWSKPSVAIRTGRSRRHRSSRGSSRWRRRCGRRTGKANSLTFPKRNLPSTTPQRPTTAPSRSSPSPYALGSACFGSLPCYERINLG